MTPVQAGQKPRAMVLGGYGLIGRACLHALTHAGFDTIGVGRDPSAFSQPDASTRWLVRDIAKATA